VTIVSFFSLALKNIKKRFGSYITYLLCTTFSVTIFYIFSAIYYNKEFVALSEESLKLNTAFKTSAVVVAIFSAVFIWYSGSFFIKQRKKEIAIYSLAGMKKRQIARMLFYESIIMGILALLCGIFLGTMFSKLSIMALVNIMKDTVNVTFSIEMNAVIVTAAVFLILFLVNALHGYSLIYRFKLINLINAAKQGEKPPRASYILAFISVGLIAGGYVLSTGDFGPGLIGNALIILGLVVVGTYILFNSFIVILIKLVKKDRKFYLNGTNLISISQLLYRIKGNAWSLATIAVLSAVAITAVGTTYSLYKDTLKMADSYAPFHIFHIASDRDLNSRVEDAIKRHSEVSLKSIDEINLLSVKTNVGGDNTDTYMMSQSQYNSAVTHQGTGPLVELKDDECYFVEYDYGDIKVDTLKGKMVSADAGSNSGSFRTTSSTTRRVINIIMRRSIIVVNDNVFNNYVGEKPESTVIRGYMINNVYESRALTEELHKLLKIYGAASCQEEQYSKQRTYKYKSSGNAEAVQVFKIVVLAHHFFRYQLLEFFS
jgi:putative ABC transport system permease protein